MSSTMQTVISIPELLILILLKCDIRTLLTSARRVSHRWQETIDFTPAIQKALFFRPDYRQKPPTLNPILVETFSLFFDGKAHNYKSLYELPIADENVMVEAFSLLFDGIVKDESRPRDAFMYKDASWQRMLVRQPPVRTMGTWNFTINRGHLERKGSFFRYPSQSFRGRRTGCCGHPIVDNADSSGNLTMGTLYDIGVDAAGFRYFTFFWNPERQASFAFAGGPKDQIVRYRYEDLKEDKLLSDLAKGMDLIVGVKHMSLVIGYERPRDLLQRFKYPCPCDIHTAIRQGYQGGQILGFSYLRFAAQSLTSR
ncbi:hypothetical protein F4680DRAFT_470311 [Xylaria scruposa]|nr:hypothetical protein F4680DRAFT_470311 [Xylaria scruposa]